MSKEQLLHPSNLVDLPLHEHAMEISDTMPRRMQSIYLTDSFASGALTWALCLMLGASGPLGLAIGVAVALTEGVGFPYLAAGIEKIVYRRK